MLKLFTSHNSDLLFSELQDNMLELWDKKKKTLCQKQAFHNWPD